MTNLALGVTVAMRDAFSAKARTVGRGFSNLDDIAYRASRGISRSADLIEADVFRIAQTFAAGFAVIGAVGFPIKKAAEFNHAMGEVASIADYATTNLEALRKEVLRQSYVYPTSMMQQVETVYQTLSSGFTDTAEALKIAESATRLGVTTMTETPQALRALTGVLNAYSAQYREAGTSIIEQLEDVEAKMFETVRYGRIRMDELGKYVGYGASASAIGGVNMEDMLASVAAMTLGSLSPEQAFQYYRQLVIGTIKPTKQAEGIAKKYGINLGKDAIVNDFGGDWSLWLKNAYDVIAVQNNSLEDFGRLLSGRQAFAGAATLINMWDKFSEARAGIASPYVVDEFGQIITSQQRAMRMLEKKLSYQLKQFGGAVESIMAVLGNQAEQWLAPVVSGMNSFLGVMLNVVDKYPIIQKAFFGIGATLGVAIMAFAALQIKLLRQSQAWRNLTVAAKYTRFSLLGMNLTAGQVIRTFGGMFTLLAGGAWLVKKAYDTNYRGFRGTVQKWAGVLNALFNAERDGSFYELDKGIWDGLTAQQRALYEGFTQWRFRLATLWEGISAGFGAFFKSFGETLKNAADTVIDFVGRISPETAERMQGWVEAFYNLKDSDVEKWRQIGKALGQIAGVVAVIGTAMLGWTAIAGTLRVAFGMMMAPFNMGKKVLWDLPRAAFGALGKKDRLNGRYAQLRRDQILAQQYANDDEGGFGMGGMLAAGAAGDVAASMWGKKWNGKDATGPMLLMNRRYRKMRQMERRMGRGIMGGLGRGASWFERGNASGVTAHRRPRFARGVNDLDGLGDLRESIHYLGAPTRTTLSRGSAVDSALANQTRSKGLIRKGLSNLSYGLDVAMLIAGIGISRGRSIGRKAQGFSLTRYLAGSEGYDRYHNGRFQRGYMGKGRHRGVWMNKGDVDPRNVGALSRMKEIHAPNMRAGAGRMAGRAMDGALLGAAFLNPKNLWGKLKGIKWASIGRSILSGIGKGLSPSNWLRALQGGLSTAMVPFRGSLVRSGVTLARAFTGPWGIVFTAAFMGIVHKWDSITQYMRDRMPTWYGMFTGLAERMKSIISGAWTSIRTFFSEGLSSIKSGFNSLNEFLEESWVGRFRRAVKSGFAEAADSIQQYAWEQADKGHVGWKLLTEIGAASRDFFGGGSDAAKERDRQAWAKINGQRAREQNQTGLTPEQLGKIIQQSPFAKASSIEDRLRASASDQYMRDQAGLTRLNVNALKKLTDNNVELPFDPTRVMSWDLSQIHDSTLRELSANASEFLANNKHKSLLRDEQMAGGRFYWDRTEAGKKRIDEYLAQSGLAPNSRPALDPEDPAGALGEMDSTATNLNKAATNLNEATRQMVKAVSPYATAEYKHLWDQSVKENYGKLYEGLSNRGSYKNTLAAPMTAEAEAEARRRTEQADKSTLESLLGEIKEGIGQLRNMGGDVLLDGEKLGRVIRTRNGNHERDNAPRGVSNGISAAQSW